MRRVWYGVCWQYGYRGWAARIGVPRIALAFSSRDALLRWIREGARRRDDAGWRERISEHAVQRKGLAVAPVLGDA